MHKLHVTDSYGEFSIETRIFELIDERMYLIRFEDQLLVVDPYEDAVLLSEIEGKSVTVFLTHEHFDHISGVNAMRQVAEICVYASDTCAKYIEDESLNHTKRFPFLFFQDREKMHKAREYVRKPYECRADVTFSSDITIDLSGHKLYMRKTPGHSPGGAMLLIDDQYLFAGDSLLGNGMELRSIGADEAAYRQAVLAYVKQLKEDTRVFPGHGEEAGLTWFLERIVG